jgi:glutamate formiminotransferase / formiminotetrahydrofolate cyclodeaminase
MREKMPNAVVECIANYSEARRPEVIDSIIEAIISVDQVVLLDRHSDNDHNRTVLTFVGPPGKIEEAAFRSIARAAELINLDEHRGEHPRIGASDVVPFVPIEGVTMAECVELAKRLGQRVGDDLGIPVYLYEQAATRPERQNLENIRRGQYEALKEEIGEKPEREPDYGPSEIGPAGATVIGARPALIAFNVYLTTGDISIAKKIAKVVRHSSGGLRYVKGLGLLVEGRAQVSMNLTNFRETSLARVVEMIRREAERYGVGIHHSELVGLIPQEALVDASIWYLQLDQFEPEQILEKRLLAASQRAAEIQADVPITGQAFLDKLASGEPTPGGGSAAAYAGAAAAALAAMVAQVTIGKKKYAEVEDRMQLILEQAENLRKSLEEAVQRDAEAFRAVMAAFKLPKDTPEVRESAIESATLNAAQEPLSVARQVVKVLELCVEAATHGNINAISDAGSGAALARAALNGAGLNVRINLKSLKDQGSAQSLLGELKALEIRAAKLEEKMRLLLSERGGLSEE